MPSPNRTPGLKFVLLILAVPAIILLGYAVMYGVTSIFPASGGSTFLHFIFAFAITALGLVIPYLALKELFHAAHEKNSAEKELALKDIPKDADRVTSSTPTDDYRE